MDGILHHQFSYLYWYDYVILPFKSIRLYPPQCYPSAVSQSAPGADYSDVAGGRGGCGAGGRVGCGAVVGVGAAAGFERRRAA